MKIRGLPGDRPLAVQNTSPHQQISTAAREMLTSTRDIVYMLQQTAILTHGELLNINPDSSRVMTILLLKK